MGVPLEALAGIGKAFKRTGVETCDYDALNRLIAVLSPLFASGYDGQVAAHERTGESTRVPASVFTAVLRAIERHGVTVIHADDCHAILVALTPMYRQAGR